MAGDDTELIEYALGILDEEATNRLERQLESEPQLAAELAEVEAALNSVADDSDDLRPDSRVRAQLLESIDPEKPLVGFTDRLSEFFDLTRERIGEILAEAARAPGASWVPSGISGVHLLHFDGGERVAAADCGLVYLEPGTPFPVHRHDGDEWTLVLQGQLLEDGVRNYAAGDIVNLEPGSQHTFCALGPQSLIFAVVLYGGLNLV